MIPATIQQLEVVGRKAATLEAQVASNIEALKSARTEREDAEKSLEELRRLLAKAEERHDVALLIHERAEVTLRSSASEYSRAQLLQKKLTNSLKELQGFNRAVVITEGGRLGGVGGVGEDTAYHQDHTAGGGGDASSSPSSSSLLRVADSCTIHAPTMRKTIAVDSVVRSDGLPTTPTSGGVGGGGLSSLASGPSSSSSSSSSSAVSSLLLVPSMVGDALSGLNVSCLMIGPKGAGKSTAMWGRLRGNGAGVNGGGGFSISPHNAATRSTNNQQQNGDSGGLLGDPSGYLLAKHFEGFDDYTGYHRGGDGGGAGAASSGNGNGASVALAPLFMHHLFTQFATYDVTHFNIRVSFVEMTMDGLVDLLLSPGQSTAAYGSGGGGHTATTVQHNDSATMPIGFFGTASNSNNSGGGGEDGGGGGGHQYAQFLATQRASSRQVRSEEGFYELLSIAFRNRSARLGAKQKALINSQRSGGAATRSNSMNTNANSATATSSQSHQSSLAMPMHEMANLYGGHLAMTVVVENFNSRGNFRRSTVLFTDVAGGITPLTTTTTTTVPHQQFHPSSPASSSSAALVTAEQQWAAKGAWALTDVISFCSAAVTNAVNNNHANVSSSATANRSSANNHSVVMHAHNSNNSSAAAVNAQLIAQQAMASAQPMLPHQSNRLVQLVKEGFGGNAKGVLFCVLPPSEAINRARRQHQLQQGITITTGGGDNASSPPSSSPSLPSPLLAAALNALAYAHYFKNTCHAAIPFDIPPELQQLTREVEVGVGVGGGESDGVIPNAYYDDGEGDDDDDDDGGRAYGDSYQNQNQHASNRQQQSTPSYPNANNSQRQHQHQQALSHAADRYYYEEQQQQQCQQRQPQSSYQRSQQQQAQQQHYGY